MNVSHIDYQATGRISIWSSVFPPSPALSDVKSATYDYILTSQLTLPGNPNVYTQHKATYVNDAFFVYIIDVSLPCMQINN